MQLLRFLTCGAADDGKSTLIGRLLHDCGLMAEGQLAALAVGSARLGTTGGDPDLALLVEGLQAEREQAITIDVAWRHFATARAQVHRRGCAGARAIYPQLGGRRVDRRPRGAADRRSPGPAHAGAPSQPYRGAVRHSRDLGRRQQDGFGGLARGGVRADQRDYLAFAAKLGPANILCIPVSALDGDNVTRRSRMMPEVLATLRRRGIV
jgi:bifunctional enzyme CysN/CysC